MILDAHGGATSYTFPDRTSEEAFETGTYTVMSANYRGLHYHGGGTYQESSANNTRARFTNSSASQSSSHMHNTHMLSSPSSLNGDTLLPSVASRKSSPRKSMPGKDSGFGKSSLLLCFISLTLFGLCIYLLFTRKCATRSDYEALRAEHDLLKMKLSEAKSITLNLKAKHQRRSKVLQNLYTSNSKLRVMLKEVCMVHVPDALKHEQEGLEDFEADKNSIKASPKNRKHKQEAKLAVSSKKKPHLDGPS